MGKTFRNAKKTFEDDNDYYGNIKNKKKKQKDLRNIRLSKKTYSEEYEDTQENSDYRR
jgi:hypothetical protein